MSSKLQREGASENEATNGGLSIVAGFPTNSTSVTGTNVYYDMSPPSCWKRFLVFLRGMIQGLTTPLCCSVNMSTTDDLTWGLRISMIGSMIGAFITGGIMGFLSSLFGCLIGREIASCAGDDDDRRTGCRVGSWTALVFAICLMLIVSARRIPKPIFNHVSPMGTNNAQSEVITVEDV
eukprot:g4778.t1